MPISSTVKFEKMEKKVFEPIPANVYSVQVMDIKEKMKAPWGSPAGSAETELNLTFEFGVLEGKYKGRKLWKDVRPVTPIPPESGMKASWLYRITSAIYGHHLTLNEGIDFGPTEMNALIGRQLRIIVNQTPPNAKGNSYNNITEVLAIEGELEPLIADNVQTEGNVPIETEGEINPADIPF